MPRFSFGARAYLHGPVLGGSTPVADRSRSHPRTSAFVDRVRLRLPLAFFNTGATALIVTDMQLVVEDGPLGEPLRWLTTRARLRPESDDGFAYATPFSIQGRATREVVAEFGHDLGWSPRPASRHRVRLQAEIHPSNKWEDVASFDVVGTALRRRDELVHRAPERAA
jgi:hypothetical protein